MRAPYIPLRHIPLPKAQPPVASYSPERRLAAVSNAYHVREVLKAAGYRWHEASKTWRRDCTIEGFRADWELFSSLGVDLDAATASLLASTDRSALADVEPITRVEIAPVAKTAQADNDDLFGPKVDDYPMKSKAAPSVVKPTFDASSLTRARERIMRLAASGRIKDAQDLAELRAIAGLIRQALEVA